MEMFTVLAVALAFAYAFGVVSYQLLGAPTRSWQDILPFSLSGVLLGEAFWAEYLPAGPSILGMHLAVAVFAVPMAAMVDLVHRRVGAGVRVGDMRVPALKLPSVSNPRAWMRARRAKNGNTEAL